MIATQRVDSSSSDNRIENIYKLSSRPIIQAQEGWKFLWTTPKNHKSLVIAVVPGPFLRPKLVKALPYVIDNVDRSKSVEKLRNGIPDPWLEYLAWLNIDRKDNKTCSKDVRISQEYQRLTDYVWNKKGLAMVQGIPDPWKFGVNCLCKEDIYCRNKNKKIKKNKNKLPESSKDKDKINEIDESNLPKRDEVHKKIDEIRSKSKKKLKNQDGFDKVKQSMTEIKTELKFKDTQNDCKVREVDKLPNSKRRDLRNSNKQSQTNRPSNSKEILCCTKLLRNCAETPLKERTTKKQENLRSVECLIDDMTYLKEEIKKPHEQNACFDLRKISSGFASRSGRCNQICASDKVKCNENLKNTYTHSDTKNSNSSSFESIPRLHAGNPVFKKIDSRINATVNKLNSLEFDAKNVKDFRNEFSQDDCFASNLKNLQASNEKLTSHCEYKDTDKVENARDSNLFFTRRYDKGKEEESTKRIPKENPETVFENNEKTMSNLHCTPDYNIIANNISRCRNRCNKRNCEGRCFANTQKKDELIIESFSDQ